jgi:predicted amidohydrolase YtcJ
VSHPSEPGTALLVARVLGSGGPDGPGPWMVRLSRGRIHEVVGFDGARTDHLGPDVVDRRDATLTPGFIDAHNHQPSAARDALVVETAHVADIGELVAVITEEASRRPRGSWIATERSLTRAQLAEGRFPTATELDVGTESHPVAIRFGAHALVLNHAGLRDSGLAHRVDDPPGGWLERDGDGRPSGPVHEYGATDLVERLLDRPTGDDLRRSLALVQRQYLDIGLTSVRIPGVRPGELDWFSLQDDDAATRPRVFAAVRVDPNLSHADKLAFLTEHPRRTGQGDDHLRIDALKLFVDGGVDLPEDEAHTMFLEVTELTALAMAAVSAGWSVTCHAVSRAAVERVLDAYEAIRQQHGPGARLAIEHAVFASSAQMRRAASLGVWLSLQPALRELNAHLIDALPSAARDEAFPLAGALGAGARVALGSDWNATPRTRIRPFAPCRTLVAATTGPQAIPADVALDLHTRGSGELVGHPSLGSVAQGAPADLLVFDGCLDAADLASPDRTPEDVFVAGHRVAGTRPA